MSAVILEFKRTCPKPCEVVSLAEGHVHAYATYCAAWWLFWFDLWGIHE